MLLINKGNKRKIIPLYSLEYYMNDGWKVMKNLDNLPHTVKYLSGKRSPDKVIDWYDKKIKMLKYQLETYEAELKLFKELMADKK